MKSDSCGTYTEQTRARIGWKPLKQIRAEGVPAHKNCSVCKFVENKEIRRGDGGFSFSPYCVHPRSAADKGHATNASATCDFWEVRPDMPQRSYFR